MRFVVALIASALTAFAGLVVVFTSTGELRGFGWLLFVVGLLGVAANLVMRSRLR